MHLVVWDDAQQLADQWIRTGNVGAGVSEREVTSSFLPNFCSTQDNDKRLSLEDAWQKFEEKEKERNLSATTNYKYALLRRQMPPWVRDRQLRLEADLERAWSNDPLVLLQESTKERNRSPVNHLPN
jgi:hypothetical protein